MLLRDSPGQSFMPRKTGGQCANPVTSANNARRPELLDVLQRQRLLQNRIVDEPGQLLAAARTLTPVHPHHHLAEVLARFEVAIGFR